MIAFKYPLSLLVFLLLFNVVAGAQVNETHRTYYKSSRPLKISHTGLFNGCSMPVGTDSIFYESGELMGTILHDNRESKTEKGCHATWTTLVQQWYYKSGHIKRREYIKSCYECNTCSCGQWTWYNEKGVVIRQASYGDCYDQQPCLDK